MDAHPKYPVQEFSHSLFSWVRGEPESGPTVLTVSRARLGLNHQQSTINQTNGTKIQGEIERGNPAELQPLYVEREGAFVLDVEGAVDRAMVDEFRNSNAH
jgi:hypothetical protein